MQYKHRCSLWTHIQLHHPKQPNEALLVYEEVTRSSDGKYTCTQCGSGYIHQKNLKEHMKIKHGGSRRGHNRQMDPELTKKEDVETVEMKDVEMQDDEE